MRQLRGKSALVTGAASGIGRAIALQLARHGVCLQLVDIDEATLAITVHEAKQLGVEADGRYCDLADRQQLDHLIWHTLHYFNGVDLLVNNAGIAFYGHTHEMRADQWDRLLEINLRAPVHLTMGLLKNLLKRPEAHVLNVASICGLVGLERVSAYTSSKFGLVGFSESLRAEYGRRGLGVTALCPGLVDTGLFDTARINISTKPKRPPKWLLASPEKIACRAVRAIQADQALVVVQPAARVLYWAKRWIPGLLDWAHHFSRRGTRQITSPRRVPQPSPSHAEQSPPDSRRAGLRRVA